MIGLSANSQEALSRARGAQYTLLNVIRVVLNDLPETPSSLHMHVLSVHIINTFIHIINHVAYNVLDGTWLILTKYFVLVHELFTKYLYLYLPLFQIEYL